MTIDRFGRFSRGPFSLDVRWPSPSERLEQTDNAEKSRQAHLDESVLRLKQRLLRVEQGHEIERSLAQTRFRYVEGLARALDHIGLQAFARGLLLQRDQ